MCAEELYPKADSGRTYNDTTMLNKGGSINEKNLPAQEASENILLALGASDKTIAEDFEKTNIWRRPELEAVWAEHAEEIAADPARKDFYLGVFGVHPESAPFVLSIIREIGRAHV